jgi:hypothetical protein
VNVNCGWAAGDIGTILHYGFARPDAVTGVAASEDICDRVLVTWNDVANDTLYHIFRDSSEVGTVPRDSTHFWDYPAAGIHSYRVRAENLGGMGPFSNETNGRTRQLSLAGQIPDTVRCGNEILLSLSHSTDVNSDSIFLVLGGSEHMFLRTISPVADTCTLFIPDTFTVDYPNSHFEIRSSRGLQVDTSVTNSFIVLRCESGASTLTALLPSRFCLAQNYPNPFNHSTTIAYDLPRAGHVSLRVFDLLGREVSALKDGFVKAGSYRVMFDGSGLASGIYFARMDVGKFSQTKKLMLLK